MKEYSDEELQRMLEAEDKTHYSGPSESSDDRKTYEFLFRALKSTPPVEPPFGFSSKVTRHIQARQTKSSNLKTYLISLVLLCLSVGMGILLVAVLHAQALQIITQVKWPALFILIGVILIQHIDRWLFTIKEKLLD